MAHSTKAQAECNRLVAEVDSNWQINLHTDQRPGLQIFRSAPGAEFSLPVLRSFVGLSHDFPTQRDAALLLLQQRMQWRGVNPGRGVRTKQQVYPVDFDRVRLQLQAPNAAPQAPLPMPSAQPVSVAPTVAMQASLPIRLAEPSSAVPSAPPQAALPSRPAQPSSAESDADAATPLTTIDPALLSLNQQMVATNITGEPSNRLAAETSDTSSRHQAVFDIRNSVSAHLESVRAILAPLSRKHRGIRQKVVLVENAINSLLNEVDHSTGAELLQPVATSAKVSSLRLPIAQETSDVETTQQQSETLSSDVDNIPLLDEGVNWYLWPKEYGSLPQADLDQIRGEFVTEE
ncbi:MAG: hypothetical protein M1830_007309 [Pleopsidium flavum]|nr:MAG: hypothetical protein M1830_007309 [Pleopsidium flavum]